MPRLERRVSPWGWTSRPWGLRARPGEPELPALQPEQVLERGLPPAGTLASRLGLLLPERVLLERGPLLERGLPPGKQRGRREPREPLRDLAVAPTDSSP